MEGVDLVENHNQDNEPNWLKPRNNIFFQSLAVYVKLASNINYRNFDKMFVYTRARLFLHLNKY
eukprot:snap_masked-scaffold_39-processed-gene-0.11-mRNA-1 protein AED:1.00 eAED:1.00 QI:0/0/0/0/1/1/3/0/63